jgi:hypothetical protein
LEHALRYPKARVQQVADVFDRPWSSTWRDTTEQLDGLPDGPPLEVSEDVEGSAGIDPGLAAADLAQTLEDTPCVADMLLGQRCFTIIEELGNRPHERGRRFHELGVVAERVPELGAVPFGERPPMLQPSPADLFPTVSGPAILKGTAAAGLTSNQVYGTMDTRPEQVGFTLNSDTPHGPMLLDLRDGPMVIELPPGPLMCAVVRDA